MATNFFIKGNYKVSVAGQDVTGNFAPLLQEISIERSAGQASDTCSLRISDAKGRTFLPQERDEIEIQLNGQWAFTGFVADVNSEGDKGGGRFLTITGNSIDHGAKVKDPRMASMDKTTLGVAATAFAAKAGIQLQVLGSIANLPRDYWFMQRESFPSWGQRIAREVGGTLKIIGNRGFMVPRNEGISASGKPLTPITAAAGDNLISWSVSPILTRPKYTKVRISYFDRSLGKHVEEEIDTSIAGVESKLHHILTVYDKNQAKQQGEAFSKESDREKGGGTVTIIGNALAEPEAICRLKGTRVGVDGGYQIDTVGHKVTKSGFITDLGVKQPKDGAGVDTRSGPKGGRSPSGTDALTQANNSALNTTGLTGTAIA